MAATIYSFTVTGVEGQLVKVEADTMGVIPSVSIVGLGDTAVKEAKDRLEAAICHCGFEFPQQKIVINLAPSDMKKKGTHFDLAMAVGILLRSKQIQTDDLHEIGFIGELSLNADIRPCSGVLPMVIAAKAQGIKKVIVAQENVQEALLVQGVEVYGFSQLQDVIDLLSGKRKQPGQNHAPQRVSNKKSNHYTDFADVKGQDMLVDYITMAAAGGHNLMMLGPPGVGKSMIAKRIPTILPQMNEQEALDVTKIYSVAGILRQKGDLMQQRPFRSPHHNASANALIGGGNNAQPGEISLAHHGVLFLDEIAEFSKKTLDSLRQPMEDRQVTITRVNQTNTYPANFMTIAALNPCPCGYFPQNKCRCTDYEVMKYRQKLSGPILDRMDIQKYVSIVDFFKPSQATTTSAALRDKVEQARDRQNYRYKNMPGITCNAQLDAAAIKQFCRLDQATETLLQKAYDRFQYSGRTIHKFIKIARTIADIDGADDIRQSDMMKSLQARDLDKDEQEMMTL